MMKKLTAALLCVLLAMTLCFCAAAEAVDYTGKWLLTAVEMAGMSFDPSALGMEMSMILNADGTCTMNAMGVEDAGTWVATETGVDMTDSEGTVDSFALVDGKLTAEQEGMKIVFTHESDIAAETETTEETTAAVTVPADYVGQWKLTSMTVSGMSMDPAALGLEMTMTLNADGTCTMAAMGETDAGTWVKTETGIEMTDSEGTVDAYTLADGQLTAEQDGAKIAFSYVGAAETADEGEYVMPRANVPMADFNGTWVFSYLELNGEYYEPAAVGMEATIVIEDSKGKCDFAYDDGTSESYDFECELEEIAEVGTVLYAMFLDPATGAQDGSGLALQLYEDGELVWYVEDENGSWFYCFALQTEE